MHVLRNIPTRILKYSAIGVAVVGLAVAGQAATSAAGTPSTHSRPSGPLLHQSATQQVTAGNRTLKKTVLVHGFSGAALTAGGFTPIDAGERVMCPGTTSCTIEAIMSVQAQGTGASNNWAICLNIDTNTATCPYIGFLDSTFFENATITESLSGRAHGAHTVQTQVFTATGGTAYNYAITYHIYTP